MINGSTWGVLHDLEHGVADDCVELCQADCVDGLVYTVGELELQSANCGQCGGRGWRYKPYESFCVDGVAPSGAKRQRR
jgi:hypothetical protein